MIRRSLLFLTLSHHSDALRGEQLGGAGPKFGSLQFGSARRRRNRRQQQESTDAAASTSPPPPSKRAEEDAWAAVSHKYGFRLKPVWMTWVDFRNELQRYEWTWRLRSPVHPWSSLSIVEHASDYSVRELLNSNFDFSKADPLTISFFAAVNIFEKPKMEHVTRTLTLTDETDRSVAIDCTGKPHPAADLDSAAAAPSCCVQTVSCVMNSAGEGDALSKQQPLFEVSGQTFAYIVLTSALRFWQGNDLGVPNRDMFMDSEESRVERAWRELRHLAAMHPSAWPLREPMVQH